MNRLRQILTERQLSQAELADMTGIPYSTVRRLLRQGTEARLDHVLLIVAALDISVEELFALDSAPPEHAPVAAIQPATPAVVSGRKTAGSSKRDRPRRSGPTSAPSRPLT